MAIHTKSVSGVLAKHERMLCCIPVWKEHYYSVRGKGKLYEFHDRDNPLTYSAPIPLNECQVFPVGPKRFDLVHYCTGRTWEFSTKSSEELFYWTSQLKAIIHTLNMDESVTPIPDSVVVELTPSNKHSTLSNDTTVDPLLDVSCDHAG